MKKSYILGVVLASAFVLACGRTTVNAQTNNTAVSADSIVINNILTRTSVRTYQDKPVEKEKIETMLRAAMAAPTAMDRRPWHYHVITDKALLQELSKKNAKFLANAPLAIVVSGDMNKTAEGGARDMWTLDCAASSENVLLAAHALGLGATWTGIYPNEGRMAAVREVLGLPDNLIPLNIIVIGYPQGEQHPKDKWDETNITYM